MKYLRSTLLLALPLAACGTEEPLDPPSLLEESAAVEFPVELWDEGVEGETLLALRVAPQGTVDSVVVHHSSGHAAFDSAAVDAARRMRFNPGRRGEERVAAWVRLPVHFSRSASSATGAPGAILQ